MLALALNGGTAGIVGIVLPLAPLETKMNELVIGCFKTAPNQLQKINSKDSFFINIQFNLW